MDGRATTDERESVRVEATHLRWMDRRGRRQEDPAYRDHWRRQQCGSCWHWLALGGVLGDDWGVCANPAAPTDGTARFEHDGCDQHHDVPDGFGVQRG